MHRSPLILAAFALTGLAAPLCARQLAPADAKGLAAAVLAANPDLSGVTLGLAPEGTRDVAIVADTDGSYGGKLTAEDDELVGLDDTIVRPEPADRPRAVVVHAALHNGDDKVAGFVRLSFKRDRHTTLLGVHARAEVLLKELAEMAGDLPALPPPPPEAPAAAGGPAPHWGKAADNRIRAQALVNQVMAAHPELIGMGLHAIPEGKNVQQIIAFPSARDLIGKPDSESDLAVTQYDGIRFEPETKFGKSWIAVLTRIRTRDGRSFGLAVLSFKHGPGVTKLSVHVAAQAIFDQLRQALPDAAALFTPSDLPPGSQSSPELLPYGT